MDNFILTVSLLLQSLSRYGLETIGIYYKLKFKKSATISLPGISAPIQLRKNTSDGSTLQQMFISCEYEIPLDFRPKAIIDAGANIGLAAIYYANLYPEAFIVSIEPDESNFEMLIKNTAAYPQVISLHKGLSDKLETLKVVDNNYGKWGMMTERNVHPKTNANPSTDNTVTIPQLMSDYNLDQLDIVKIDIEGFEKELFESNYEDWLPKTRCLIVEVHDRLKEGCSTSLFKAISNYNFSFSVKGENLVFVNNTAL